MSTQWFPHSTVACICEHNGKFLIVKERVNGQMVYNQPAGHIEDNESILDATLRETLEETGCRVKLTSSTGIYRYRISNDMTFIRFSMVADLIEQTDLPLDPQITSVHWFSYEEIVALKDQLRGPLVLKTIEDYRNGITLPLSFLDNNH